jgi:hypothetical protein
LRFFGIILVRFTKILFRRRKNIEIIYLNYSDKHLFESSYIILNYHFKNAIWYRFGKYRTTEKHIKIFNLVNFDKEFDLVVIGFFRKKVFRLKFEPSQTLVTENFKTEFQHLNNAFELKPTPDFYRLPLSIMLNEIKSSNSPIRMQKNKIELQTNKYNQTDFI